MNHPFLQSTLRELQVFLRSRRFWGTFAAIVLLFAITGPYGTMERMGFGERLAYWLSLHALAWAIAILCAIMAENLLRGMIASMFARMMTGSLAAALPIGFAIGLVDYAFTGATTTLESSLQRALFSLPLCALFCSLTYMAMNEKIAEAAAPQESKPGASILDRLKPENRGPLLRLSVRDHYTKVVTSRGCELVLLRFADALKETKATPGLRVHRSHWVADAHVEGVKRDNGRLMIRTRDGTEIPVSRSYAEDVRRRFM
ncbi:response regulator transcription factor [Rhizobium lentis]|uniref:LytTR family DNA-binding domain-containing protein n=1 Tax=Rhizobium lentis TaxID=1138194 RepID=UPI001C8354D6|nr:LytTR family DNA-binding domain-containing protein [Rhizobium lentis]MBX5039969.1 response regulator transcription factor [Rhizobium lentis]MBX5052930.1 response regulator transcription factor [Rhizobium lentis]MBX5069594.1 response regulator transcription factor [Rhizobium lentis]MBX5107857.1 response regulator transcription factor [Rhizobium lentis]MBX5113704.1 response regulator transcription factor [Rhizobium lentis]